METSLGFLVNEIHGIQCVFAELQEGGRGDGNTEREDRKQEKSGRRLSRKAERREGGREDGKKRFWFSFTGHIFDIDCVGGGLCRGQRNFQRNFSKCVSSGHTPHLLV